MPAISLFGTLPPDDYDFWAFYYTLEPQRDWSLIRENIQ